MLVLCIQEEQPCAKATYYIVKQYLQYGNGWQQLSNILDKT